MTKRRIHLIYSIVLSAVTVIAGICLIMACIGIYNSGDRPFSREAVAAAFSGIAVPVYLFLALVIGGFILDGFWPGEKRKQSVEKQYGVILRKLHRKLDLNSCDSALRTSILVQQKRRKLHKIVCAVLLVIGSTIFLSYGMNSSNFHQTQINDSMVSAMKLFFPCLAVPFAYAVFCAYYGKASMKKEIELVKQAIAGGSQAVAPKAAVQPKDHSKQLLIARCVLLGIGVVILVCGFIAGGTKDVLTKAINICTECVGLG